MCGRAYSTYTEEELAWRYWSNQKKKREKLPEIKPNYNMSPTHKVPVIRKNEEGESQLDFFSWGLIPAWSPEFKTKFSTINAKSESVFESRLYSKAILNRRCIVPVSGFIEWKCEDKGAPKRPFKIFLKESPIMSLAGIWEGWRVGTDEERYSFSILTTEANKLMKGIHDRMPVILSPKAEEAWLDPELEDPKKIAKLLNSYDPKEMATTEISTMINSPKNNRPEVLMAVRSG